MYLCAQVGILLLVFPILRAIALHTLSTSVLTISASNITSPTNNSFGLTLEGQAHKVGIFPARLNFERPVDVSSLLRTLAAPTLTRYKRCTGSHPRTSPRSFTSASLLWTTLASPPATAASSKRRTSPSSTSLALHASPSVSCPRFQLRLIMILIPFEVLITQEAFTWRLRSESVQAKAFGFIAANKLSFVKVGLTCSQVRPSTDLICFRILRSQAWPT